MRLGYLYSRYPVISQTFCDAEMLALERLGIELEIGSVYPPLTSLRHEHISRLRASVRYAPPQEILKIWEKDAKTTGKWPGALVSNTTKIRPGLQGRTARAHELYFADLLRATASIILSTSTIATAHRPFLKEISKISFSITARTGFMKDLGNDDLLREICAAPRLSRLKLIPAGAALTRGTDFTGKFKDLNGIDWSFSCADPRRQPIPRILASADLSR